MKTGNALIACLLGMLLAAGCGDDSGLPPPQYPDRDTLEVAFQDGVHPYETYFGTRDAVIKDGPSPAFINGNFGAEPRDTLGVVRAGSGYYERRLLVRMDLSGLSGCSAVIDARLSLRIESDLADPLVLEVYEVEVPPANPASWTEGTGELFAGVSWSTVDGTAPWVTAGGDYAIAMLDAQTVHADTAVTFALPGPLVLAWIKEPSTNHGVIIRARDTGDERYVLVHLRESSIAADRPKLELLYLKSG